MRNDTNLSQLLNEFAKDNEMLNKKESLDYSVYLEKSRDIPDKAREIATVVEREDDNQNAFLRRMIPYNTKN